MPRHHATVTLVALCLLVPAAGCGSSNSTAHPTAPTSTTPPTTRRPTTTIDRDARDRAEIKATVEGWSTLVASYYSEQRQWDEASSAELLTGRFLEDARRGVQLWQKQGKRTRAPNNSIAQSTIDIIEKRADRATVRECQVNDLIVESANGSILDDRIGTYHLTWLVIRTRSGWRISELINSKTLVGTSECPR